MKLLVFILLFSNILFSATINQKMIIDMTTEPQSSTYKLQEIKDFFQQNDMAKTLKEKYHLTIEEESLDNYTLVVLRPIRSILLKNRLKLLLNMQYPKSFFVSNTINIKKKDKPIVKNKIVTQGIKMDKKIILAERKTVKEQFSKGTFSKNIFNEWSALVALAFIGLFLVYRNAKQTSKIKRLQRKLEEYQTEIINELDIVGGGYE